MIHQLITTRIILNNKFLAQFRKQLLQSIAVVSFAKFTCFSIVIFKNFSTIIISLGPQRTYSMNNFYIVSAFECCCSASWTQICVFFITDCVDSFKSVIDRNTRSGQSTFFWFYFIGWIITVAAVGLCVTVITFQCRIF